MVLTVWCSTNIFPVLSKVINAGLTNSEIAFVKKYDILNMITMLKDLAYIKRKHWNTIKWNTLAMLYVFISFVFEEYCFYMMFLKKQCARGCQ